MLDCKISCQYFLLFIFGILSEILEKENQLKAEKVRSPLKVMIGNKSVKLFHASALFVGSTQPSRSSRILSSTWSESKIERVLLSFHDRLVVNRINQSWCVCKHLNLDRKLMVGFQWNMVSRALSLKPTVFWYTIKLYHRLGTKSIICHYFMFLRAANEGGAKSMVFPTLWKVNIYNICVFSEQLTKAKAQWVKIAFISSQGWHTLVKFVVNGLPYRVALP